MRFDAILVSLFWTPESIDSGRRKSVGVCDQSNIGKKKGMKIPIDNIKIPPLFYQGKFDKIIQQLQPFAADLPHREFTFLIGALCFTGQIDDALWLVSKYKPTNQSALIAAQFYLGIGLTRLSKYELAAGLFAKNLFAARKSSQPLDLFYAHQGAAFYRYFCGLIEKSWAHAQIARNSAIESRDIFATTIALDLSAHIEIAKGNLHSGLDFFKKAMSKALEMKATWLADSIKISQEISEAQFGMTEPQHSLFSLLALSKKPNWQDNYSQCVLMIAIARIQVLMGSLSDAEITLAEASRIIYRTQHRRTEIQMNAVYAEIMFRKGQPIHGLNFVRHAKHLINNRVDVRLLIHLLGIEKKVLEKLNMRLEMDSCNRELTSLTKRFGIGIPKRIFERQALSNENRKGLDPLGDLVDELALLPDKYVFQKTVKLGYLGLLASQFQQLGDQVIFFDLVPSLVLIFDRGNISKVEPGIPKQLRSLCSAIFQYRTKEELVKVVWGYNYKPLKHDTLLYTSIRSVRKLLGNHSHWILSTEYGYEWASGVTLHFNLSEKLSTSPRNRKSVPDNPRETYENLNFRQTQILEFLLENRFIDQTTCTHLFSVSKITATRDLTDLARSGLISRCGKARATKYFLIGKPK